jgi:hypothetical protein
MAFPTLPVDSVDDLVVGRPARSSFDGGTGAILARRRRRASLERGIRERGSRYEHKFSHGSASTMTMRALSDVMRPENGARASATWGSRAERGTRR